MKASGAVSTTHAALRDPNDPQFTKTAIALSGAAAALPRNHL